MSRAFGGHDRRVYSTPSWSSPSNALVVISTLYTAGGPLAEAGAAAASTTINKTNLAQTAFGVAFGEGAGNMFVAVCLFFFAFSTILSWNMFGKINMIYLFGKKSAAVYSVIGLVVRLPGHPDEQRPGVGALRYVSTT